MTKEGDIMRFLSEAHTDIGITKKINQDAYCMKIASTKKSNIAFAVLCDGMGGLKSGELASAFVVNAYSNWFENELPAMLMGTLDFTKIQCRWNELAVNLGKKIMEYGKSKGISLGTTLTAILMIDNKYIYIQVGDSRIYQINSVGIKQITKDHTVIAHEIEQKRLTEEEAKHDARRNVLLQCIGASRTVVPDIQTGIIQENDVFMICSDGFRHKVVEEEMYGIMAPSLLTSERMMKKSLIDLVELNKSRKENDNITALLIKAIH